MAVLEISDLVAQWDPATGKRIPVRRGEVVARLREAGDGRAARIVERMPVDGEQRPGPPGRMVAWLHTATHRRASQRMPADSGQHPDTAVSRRVARTAHHGKAGSEQRSNLANRLHPADDGQAEQPKHDGILDPAEVDRLLIRVHAELQRLNEEVHMAQRFAELLSPVLDAARAAGIRPRVVDIGCGLGFLVRSLASSGTLGRDVELIGVDFNPALVAEANRLAREEGISCEFVCGDAFALAQQATVYLSCGVLHHFPADVLPEFFREQDRSGAQAFIHYDIAPTRLATFGAWLFHRARMREPLGRHDGVASARRAHADAVLLSAAEQVSGMEVFLFEPSQRTNPLCASMRPVVGLRPELTEDVLRRLGRRARGLVRA